MWECCNKRLMIVLIALLLLCSLFILLLGEYMETNFGASKLFSRQSSSTVGSGADSVCKGVPGNNATAALAQSCQKCTDFEINALQLEHCRPSGYFNSFTCSWLNGSATSVFRPCVDILHPVAAHNENVAFYAFSFGSFLCTALFGTFVRWRKELQERRAFAYQRLAAGS